jgi:hypothetical protein
MQSDDIELENNILHEMIEFGEQKNILSKSMYISKVENVISYLYSQFNAFLYKIEEIRKKTPEVLDFIILKEDFMFPEGAYILQEMINKLNNFKVEEFLLWIENEYPNLVIVDEKGNIVGGELDPSQPIIDNRN